MADGRETLFQLHVRKAVDRLMRRPLGKDGRPGAADVAQHAADISAITPASRTRRSLWSSIGGNHERRARKRHARQAAALRPQD
jgi:hypothetical protein